MNNNSQTRVAVVYGGTSSERAISIKSGSNVIGALERMGYAVSPFDLNKESLKELSKLSENDLVFLALHGKYGEDGYIQGYLDLLGIKYTGSNMLSSALCFDKEASYRYVGDNAVSPSWISISSVDELKNWNGFPAVIKPLNEGSSIGVKICDNDFELREEMETSLETHGKIMVQEYIEGRELAVSIIEIDDDLTVLPILELKPRNRFYDYAAKYTAGLTDFIVPAPLEEPVRREIERTAKRVFEELGCRGFARIDGILRENVFYFLEINTIPGLTDLSDLPISARAMGISFDELIDMIIKNVLRR